MMAEEPDLDEEEEAYYKWKDRVNVLHDMIDSIDAQIEWLCYCIIHWQGRSLNNLLTGNVDSPHSRPAENKSYFVPLR